MELTDAARAVAERARAAGGRALIVGGAVRDRLLGLQPADFDIEVTGVDPARVLAFADGIGQVRDVGKTFGVLEVRPHVGGRRSAEASAEADWTLHISVPRRESKIAPGHQGFLVGADPAMSSWEAARRRDFTINAIAEDPLTGEILDPFRGRDDLQRRVLRVVDADTFGDDPLRVLRGGVFAAQFELAVDPGSDEVIRRTVPSLRELPRERIGEEWRKLLLRPRAPSRGLRLLMDWGAFAVLHPEFSRLPNTPQNPRWHPEGDVWTHTLMAVDEAAVILNRAKNLTPRSHPERQRRIRGCGVVLKRAKRILNESEGPSEGSRDPLVASGDLRMTADDCWQVMLATLCHDLGKATMTVEDLPSSAGYGWSGPTSLKLRGAGRGDWHSRGHDAAGVESTRRFLKSIAANRRTTEVVVRLVRQHLVPLLMFNAEAKGQRVTDGAVRALSRRLHPASIFLLTIVADADHRGRGRPQTSEVSPSTSEVGNLNTGAGAALRKRAATLGIINRLPEPVLRGSDLISLGLPPGPAFGEILRRAEELRDERGDNRETLLERLRGAASTDEALARLG